MRRLADFLIRLQARFLYWQLGFFPTQAPATITVLESLRDAAVLKPDLSPATRNAIVRLVMQRRRGTKS